VQRILNLWANQPALVVGFIAAIIALLTAFGLSLNDEQTAAILGVVGAIGAILAAWIVRSQVTPVNKKE
jgi:membrane associated rhomboid family serine protease